MLGQLTAGLDTGAANMHYNLKARPNYTSPTLSQSSALVVSQQISFARRTVDENTFKPIAFKQAGIRLDRFEIYFSGCIKRSKRSIDQPYYLFHNY